MKRVKFRLQEECMKLENDPQSLNSEYNQTYYNYLKRKLKQMELEEIQGYTKRLKLLAPYDKAEPKIAFYADLEQKKASKDIIGQLAEHSEGTIHTDKNKLMDITTNFYKNLYTPNRVNTRTQDKLLKLIKNKFTKEQRETLDAR